jgi:putative DNA primase/helicase
MNTNTTDPDPQTLIAQVISYYARYLSASPEHLDLLALWTLHTHCFQGASFSPALHITSRHKQSGKTLCLHLLNDLCRDPWLHTSPSPALVTRQTQGRTPGDSFDGTLLLDDCRIGTRLSGVLTASFCWEGTQIVLGKDYRGNPDFDRRKTFFPKAIVTRDRLPESLKETSIPLALEPKAPGSPCRRYKYSDEASELCQSLQQTLGRWGLENFDRVSQMASSYEESQFPPEFSSRQQDCAEPLLQVAELIGGEWPQRARNALINIFALSAFGDFFSSRQILSDLRDAFTAKNNPEWISTADLLEFLHAMDDRAWDDWNKGKPMNPKDLAALLKPFGLGPANHRTESGKVIKGYKLQHLEPSWARHLPNSKIPVPQQPTCGTERQAISPATTDDTGAHTRSPSLGGTTETFAAREKFFG